MYAAESLKYEMYLVVTVNMTIPLFPRKLMKHARG